MAEQKISPGLKMALEMGPILAFFVGFMLLKDKSFQFLGAEREGFILITALFIPVMIASTYALYRLTGKISKMQVLTLVLVVIFGGLTVWLNDKRFIKMKPTMIYAIFAGILGFGLLRGRSYLRIVMEELLPMEPEGWMILTKRVALFFVALAVLNEIIWRNFSDAAWVNFKTFGLTFGVFIFFMTQSSLFQKYTIEKEDGDEPS